MGLLHVLVFGAVLGLSLGHHYNLNTQSRNQDIVNRIQKSILTPDYNINVRPYDERNENGTTQVKVQFKDIRVIETDETRGRITVQGYFRQKWVDPRLAFDKNLTINYFPLREAKGKIWIPDLFFDNYLESLGGGYKPYRSTAYVGISYDGSVFASKRMTKTFFCPQLYNREAKEVLCESRLLSYGYYDDELQLSFDEQEAFINNVRDTLSLEKFNFEGVSSKDCPQRGTPGHIYSCVNIVLKLTRK